jgi:tetratricopeptide (TPR) repeat protein
MIDEALGILNQLVQEHPQNTDYRLTLAQAYRVDMRIPPWFGRPGGRDARRDGGDRDEGWKRNEDSARRAIDILETLVREHPGAPEFQYELGDTLCDTVRSPWGDREEQLQRLERTASICGELTRAYPQVAQYQMLTAATERRFAMLHLREAGAAEEQRRMQSAGEALRRLENAADEYRRLTERFPSVSLYQIALARTLSESAIACQLLKDLPAALQQAEEAVAAAENCRSLRGDDPQFRVFVDWLTYQRDRLASGAELAPGAQSPPPPGAE